MSSTADSKTKNGECGEPSSLRGTLRMAAWFGLVAGFGEGIVDLTAGHYHAPAILCVTLLADTGLFLALGLVLWLAGRLCRRSLSAPLVFFVLAWATFFCLLGNSLGVIAGILSGVAGLLAGGNRRRVAWFVRASLPWAAGAAVAAVVAIPSYGWWAERQAMAALAAGAPDAPNVVLVVLDAVRADHLSCYGYTRATSPTIDRLAKDGTLFETAISPSSWTLPSHASMMTGAYPHTHQADEFADELPARFPTLAWSLREQGYRTAAFSANQFFFTRQHGLGRGFIHFGDFFLSPGDALARVHWAGEIQALGARLGWVHNLLGRQAAEDINRAALEWLGTGRRPFFLALNYFDAHDPYVPPQPWRHRFSADPNPGGRIDFLVPSAPPWLSPAQLQGEMDAYDGGIAYEDDQLGQFLRELDRRGLLRNTLVIVTADHGEAFGTHGLLEHANALYFPLVHVPLIFAWPGQVPAGTRVAQPVSTKDIAATILALTGQSGELPGESLEALWQPGADARHWPLPIAELARLRLTKEFPDYYGPLATVVSPEAQYIMDPRKGPLLYDWKNDPKEVRNLIQDPRYLGLAADLSQELRAEQTAAASLSVARAAFPGNGQ